MSSSIPYHAQFIRAVRRRLILVRALENLGRCLAVGCAVSIVLLPIVLWRLQPAWPLVMFIGGICLLMAGALTVQQWPTEADAAAEADRQFNLSDLLTTAFSLHSRDDDFTVAVIALADARCRGLSPGTLVLNRLGARAWGGIGLSVALVLTLTILSTGTRTTDGADVNSSWLAQTSSPHENQLKNAIPIDPDHSFSSQRHIAGADEDPINNEATGMKSVNQLPAQDSGASAVSSKAFNDHAGNGRDFGRTDNGVPARGNDNALMPKFTRSNGQDQPVGITAGGFGAAANHAAVGGQAAGTSVGKAATVAPPWESAGWSGAIQQAREEISSGAIPDQYHDVVRDYFKRE